MFDIYFDTNYGKLYEEIENGKSETFIYECEYGKIQHTFIKRMVPTEKKEKEFYDIVTPYGYGGPILINSVNKEKLIELFQKAFEEYCIENNIVSEFIRFHPVLKNHEDFQDIYSIRSIRRTVGTNLRDYDDPFQSEFSKSCRKNVRKALKNDVTYKITEGPDDIKEFLDIYYSTMDRNTASDYYYFDQNYFDKCLTYFKDNIVIVEAMYEEKTIAMGFYFTFGKYIHTHLSGTLSEYLYLSPAYVLRYALTEWGKENNYELIHHGGGTTNSEEDSLYKFKKQFGKNTEFYFYIGKKIWDDEVYNELCNLKGIDTSIEFFPAYRYEK